MENQEYLNQISTSSAPVQPAGKSKGFDISGILHSKIFLFAIIGVVLFILLAIVGALLSGNKKDTKTDIIKLRYHISSTSELISIYQPNVKSSILRSHSASLQSILSDTNNSLADYIVNKYSYKESKDDQKLAQKIIDKKDELNNDLFSAKINGNLDRFYAHTMASEITDITAEESALYDSAKDDTLKAILEKSYNSLETLYVNFNEFSETK